MEETVYIEFIKNVILKTNILHLGQLRRMLCNAFPELAENKKYDDIIINAQSHGIILITKNMYVITKSYYKMMTQDKFFDGLSMNSTIQVPEEMPLFERKADGTRYNSGTITIANYLAKKDRMRSDILNCMWVVARYMPNSKDFIIGNYPWLVVFENCKKIKQTKDNPDNPDEPLIVESEAVDLIEVTYITQKTEDSRIEMIRSVGNVRNDMRSSIRRIAIIENEAHAWKIPYYGFTDIIANDMSDPRKFKILERRAVADAWKDYGDFKE